MNTNQAYKQSGLVRKLNLRRKNNLPLKLAFLDVDSTLTGGKAETESVRSKLESFGYGIIYVTARTEEMMMSDKEYRLSREKYGFDRPVPNRGAQKDGSIGIYDPDIIIGSTGTCILVRQTSGGYCCDCSFQKQFSANSQEWREKALASLQKFKPIYRLAPIEFEDNYWQGKTDVFPPDYRIHLLFDSIKDKKDFIKAFKKNRKCNFLMIKENAKPNRLYLLPRKAGKKNAVDWVIDKLSCQLKVREKAFHILIAGDDWPDVEMGLLSAKKVKKSTFILVGGSSLTPYLQQYLREQQDQAREIVIGDLIYPGIVGPGTILKYLDNCHCSPL
jgi:hydroxymethylpyrimidine pyrophosphatase-like HAD family hydrolase